MPPLEQIDVIVDSPEICCRNIFVRRQQRMKVGRSTRTTARSEVYPRMGGGEHWNIFIINILAIRRCLA